MDQDPPLGRGHLDQPRPWPPLAQRVAAPAAGPPTRLVRPLPAADPPDELGPLERGEELWRLGLWPVDLGPFDLPSAEADPSEADDRFGELLRIGDTAWTLDLDDPYRWQDRPEPVDVWVARRRGWADTGLTRPAYEVADEVLYRR